MTCPSDVTDKPWKHISQGELLNHLALPKRQWGKQYRSEDEIMIKLVEELVAHTLTGNLKALWLHPPNEQASKGNFQFNFYLKLMGRLSGAPDLIFLWENGCGCLEVKTKKGSLNANQQIVKKWCFERNIPYRIVRTVQEGLDVLKEWGILLT